MVVFRIENESIVMIGHACSIFLFLLPEQFENNTTIKIIKVLIPQFTLITFIIEQNDICYTFVFMRFISFFTVFFLCSVLTAQSDSLYFTPKWKRGDEQKVRFNRSERTYDADKLIKDTSYYFEAKYIVRAEDDTSYQLFVKSTKHCHAINS